MESEFDTTGVITKISDGFSIVTVTINNVPMSFSFSKYLLYVFGFQCEGQMSNILDEGMEVDVCYKLSTENVPYIVAVWISEKPDHLCKNCALKPFYEQTGKVIEVTEDHVLVRIDSSDRTVLISKEVSFRDECRTKTDSSLVEGEAVAFDAIPFESEHPTGASYQATCAWVGPAPVLVERFGLSILTLDESWDVQGPTDVVHGTVTVIPNEVVAFAEMKCVQHNGKVLLFRGSFVVHRGCANIKDLINIGDSLCMRIRYKYLFDGIKQFYAVRAWKDGCEDSYEMSLMENDKNPIEGPVGNLGVATEAAVVGNQSDEGRSKEGISYKKTRKRQKKKTENHSALETASVDLHLASSKFSKFPIFSKRDKGNATLRTKTSKPEYIEKRGVLSNYPPLSGVISIISQDEAYIVFDGLMIYVDRKSMFKDGKPLTNHREYDRLVACGNQEVFFEAVESNSKTGFTHEATCVWIGEKPSALVRTDNSPENRFETKFCFNNSLLQTKTEMDKNYWVGKIPSLFSMDSSISRQKSPESARPKQKEPAQTAYKYTEVKFTPSSPVLYCEDRPLKGIVTHDTSAPREAYRCMSFDSVCISFEGRKVFLDCELMYYEGKPCSNETILDMVSRDVVVNFEAVKTSDGRKILHGYLYEATCAWVGQRPGLTTILRTLPPMKFALLEEDRTYRGVVRRFCLPKVALVYESEHDTTVSLHVSAFGRKPKQLLDFTVGGKDCISAFVKLNDIVEFKLTCVPTFAHVLSAKDVKIVSENKNTPHGSPLFCPFPEKSTSTERGTVLRFLKSSQATKLGVAEGAWSPYPLFETPVRKEVPVEAAKFTNKEAKVEMPFQSVMGQHPQQTQHPELTATPFDDFFSDQEKTASEEAKGETGNITVPSPLTQRSSFSHEDIITGVAGLSKGNINSENFGKVSAEFHPLCEKQKSISGFIPKSPSFQGYPSTLEDNPRTTGSLSEKAEEGTGVTRERVDQPTKRSLDLLKCSVM